MKSGDKHEEGAELIRKAFAVARESGTPEWQTMTTAVLKNRLLDLTKRSFQESDWGASTFREFIEQFEDVVRLNLETRPSEVSLLGPSYPDGALAPVGRDIGPQRRIRRDLWEAVLDYGSGNRYVWDGADAQAIPAGADLPVKGKLLPTLSEEEFKEWRASFVTEQSAKRPEVASLLYGWLERGEPLGVLPTFVRVPWVVDLKLHVLGRLEQWFQREGLSPPEDLVVEEPSDAGKGDTDVLRERILDAVRQHGAR